MRNFWLALLLSLFFALLVYFLLKKRLERLVRPDHFIKTLQEEIDGLLVELNRTTDRNVRLLEEKIKTLTDLLAASDKRVALLSKEAENKDLSRKLYARLGEQKKPSFPKKKEEKREEEATQKAYVLRLHGQGISSDRIASRCHMTVGEVELIISLHRSQKK